MTKHFQHSEFACKHCGATHVSNELLAVLELVRCKFDAPVTITSGFRCKTHNTNVGGAPNSKHMDGIAADIKVKGVAPKKVYNFLCDTFPEMYGIGLYTNWVHIDVRNSKARW